MRLVIDLPQSYEDKLNSVLANDEAAKRNEKSLKQGGLALQVLRTWDEFRVLDENGVEKQNVKSVTVRIEAGEAAFVVVEFYEEGVMKEVREVRFPLRNIKIVTGYAMESRKVSTPPTAYIPFNESSEN